MRGGLAWLDASASAGSTSGSSTARRGAATAVLDDIAVAAQTTRRAGELSHGVAFFSSFRDLTASGFWTSKMGIDDLQYMGNRLRAEWNGCPDEALKKLGVSNPQ